MPTAFDLFVLEFKQILIIESIKLIYKDWFNLNIAFLQIDESGALVHIIFKNKASPNKTIQINNRSGKILTCIDFNLETAHRSLLVIDV